MKNTLIVLFTLLVCASIVTGQTSAMSNSAVSPQSGSGNTIFLPLVRGSNAPPPTQPIQTGVRVNTPYFSDHAGNHFNEAAIFWFGKVSPTENYADLRFAYDNDILWVYISTFDQNLWYDPSPTSETLSDFDSATLQLNLNGNTGSTPDSSTYRFDTSMSWPPAVYHEADRYPYQAAYRWQGNSWLKSNVYYTTVAGYDGSFNGNLPLSFGWALTFQIPFSSLGLTSRPADGAIWGVSMTMHDRDSAAGPPQPDKSWPAGFQATAPSSWAQLRFGLPNYGAVAGSAAGTVLIRRPTQNSPEVPDATLGGILSDQCGNDKKADLWNLWGNSNYGDETGLIIQNQSKITDWPCYAKYYVSFPLSSVPANKKILSAILILHHWGSSGPQGEATPSLIQVLTVSGDWSENTITWNNAPAPIENVSQSWVNIPANFDYQMWPGIPTYWDVTAAASRAYLSGQPLSMALYEADDDYHSGKYFVASDAQDWNIAGRPSLEIKWGNP